MSDDGYLNIAVDEARKVAQRLVDDGHSISNVGNTANVDPDKPQQEWFGIMGHIITDPLNSWALDPVGAIINDMGQLMAKGGESMKQAIDHISGTDQEGGANIATVTP
ncbi:hypothetical protein [Segniliparus rugosus]|uniref:Uncharacterized protein n=1 Tax=Segniliparus rugosus (strain ATCC BAA-974 / DSM 45345 / CCUG 50838 / CIP 108380 / JCM 13579 / CDC 945) TaxID=679197 RepID=E5XV19_SEGRC|nr:hypothetical protein [Segniliparus rugosus]EFV11855.1 hypothetical protein HMPREF9336_03341 [Segniliparus rugosus ATCC BAA-974]